MESSIVRYFFPDLKASEQAKFLLLSLIAFTILSTYWLMWLLKQTIFFKVSFPESLGWQPHQGALFQPLAKTYSPFVVLGLVLIYSKLVDLVKKQQLFYIICAFYSIIFGSMSLLLFFKEWYGPAILGKNLLAALGWVYFFAAESFGSLVITLFWSFTNSITDTKSAERGFPIITAAAQLGAMSGAAMLLLSKQLGLIWPLVMLISLMTATIGLMVYYFTSHIITDDEVVPPYQPSKPAPKKEKQSFLSGFINGLLLLVTTPYLLGILIISVASDIPLQILEYLMHSYASLSEVYGSPAAFSWFQGIFGLATNSFSFILALLGTRYFIKKLGTQGALLLYPIIFGVTFIALLGCMWSNIFSTNHLLWIIFGCMTILKGTGYAFNNPVKEIMYIPTTKEAKFKAKGWIDMFGGRFAKAGGAQVTSFYKHNLTHLLLFGGMISLGMVVVWIMAAIIVGRKNKEAIEQESFIA